MTAKWELKEGNEGVLTFEVDAKTFDGGLDKAFKKVVKQVSLPGFRKGKIPRPLFEKRFGVESLYQDAVDFVLPDAYRNAVEESGIEPIDQPEIDVEQVEKGKDVIFTAKVQVKPEVTLGDYEGLEVEDEDVSVTDEDLAEDLEQQREKFAELVVKEEGSVEKGDTVDIDFEGFLDGVAFEGGKAEGHQLEIGSGQFIPGFEDELIGKDADGEYDINITFPEEYQAEELAGKPAVFKVKINEIKAKELPELDDEFAKDVDEEVETLDELRTKRKEQLEDERKQAAENNKRESLVNKASDNAEVDIPEVMIKSEEDRMLSEFEQRLQMQGMNLDTYYQMAQQTEEDLRGQMKEDAGKRVKTSLTLEAIFNKEELEVTEEDVDKELESMSSMYKTDVEQLKQMLGGNTDMLKEELKTKKAIDFLAEKSVVKK